ncbi:MAG: zinc ribbon domain-containing protein, partial [Deltaproteobacteria bacterium]|nr:zinc ribbon domain-containing protein [Deltaproteobacteria bacterium]
MDCPNCQRSNPAGNAFCGGCGAPLALACPTCGRENPPDHKFCGGCGRSLESVTVPLSGAPGENLGQSQGEGQSPFSPRDYTPKHLADKILTRKSALEGERKQVTVLFADVK